MKLAPVVIRLRAANMTKFGNHVVGAAELALALNNTLIREYCFVVQLNETAAPNKYDSDVSQVITETFAVIVALKNDLSQADKTGLTAYDSLFDVRTELLTSLLGWEVPDDTGISTESLVEYAGGKVLDINAAWLWYQYDFSARFRIEAVENSSGLDELSTPYTQAIMTPSAEITITGPDGLPVDTSLPDFVSSLDFTENPDPYGYNKGFGYGFKISSE